MLTLMQSFLPTFIQRVAPVLFIGAVLSGCDQGPKKAEKTAPRSNEQSSAEIAPLISQAAALCEVNPDSIVDLMKAPMTGQKWVKLTKGIPLWPDAMMNAYSDVRVKAGPKDGGEIYFERHAMHPDWQKNHDVRFVIDGRNWQPKSSIKADNIVGSTAETVQAKISLAQLSLIVTAEVVEVHVGNKSALLTPEQRKLLAGIVKMWYLEAGTR